MLQSKLFKVPSNAAVVYFLVEKLISSLLLPSNKGKQSSKKFVIAPFTRVGIKKPTPKKPKKTHLKKPIKMGFLGFFLIFNFL
jgi:hypothetical protein